MAGFDDLSEQTFHWATGIEDTFITAPWPRSGRSLDEYALTDHYERWREDIDLLASLGVRTARYGIPWHRICPSPGTWDWDWTDAALEHLLARGVDPIIDLVHYGVPSWLEGAWLHPDLTEHIAEYATRVAQRYQGRIRAYTPLNEPRITAWYCGRIGWWPPNLRGWKGFVAVLTAVCRAIATASRALLAVDPSITLVHVDAGDIWDASDPSLQEHAEHLQRVGFLALDLVGGRVTPAHPLLGWLASHGVADATLQWFRDCATPIDVVGVNCYPMFSAKTLVRTPRGHVRTRIRPGGASLMAQLVSRYWQHFGRPVIITETSARGSVARRLAWLEASVDVVRRLRAAGVPVIGYTWWPMFALVAWAWRQGSAPVSRHLQQMGLWNLDASLDRVETPLVCAYRRLVEAADGPIGPIDTTEDRHVRELLHRGIRVRNRTQSAS